jgi:hypothetical protein
MERQKTWIGGTYPTSLGWVLGEREGQSHWRLEYHDQASQAP